MPWTPCRRLRRNRCLGQPTRHWRFAARGSFPPRACCRPCARVNQPTVTTSQCSRRDFPAFLPAAFSMGSACSPVEFIVELAPGPPPMRGFFFFFFSRGGSPRARPPRSDFRNRPGPTAGARPLSSFASSLARAANPKFRLGWLFFLLLSFQQPS